MSWFPCWADIRVLEWLERWSPQNLSHSCCRYPKQQVIISWRKSNCFRKYPELYIRMTGWSISQKWENPYLIFNLVHFLWYCFICENSLTLLIKRSYILFAKARFFWAAEGRILYSYKHILWILLNPSVASITAVIGQRYRNSSTRVVCARGLEVWRKRRKTI